jgi:hypothetical protein
MGNPESDFSASKCEFPVLRSTTPYLALWSEADLALGVFATSLVQSQIGFQVVGICPAALEKSVSAITLLEGRREMPQIRSTEINPKAEQ